MGLSLSDLNPVKAVKSAFGAATGVSGLKDAQRSANRITQKALADALAALDAGDESAIQRLIEGRDTVLSAVNTGFDQGIEQFQPIADLFNPEGIRQGLTLEGLGNTIQQITDPSGIFAPLIADRTAAANDALSAAGFRRSGRAAESAAEIPLEIALGISDTLFSRNVNNPALGAIGNIAQLSVDRGRQVGSIEADLASSLAGIDLAGAVNEANTITGQGASAAQTALNLGQLDAQTNRGLLNLFGGPLLEGLGGGIGGALGGIGESLGGILGGATTSAAGGLGGLISGGLGSVIGMFSDERMKTNLEVISVDGPFVFYQWDWKPEVKALGLPLMDVGLLAQDVLEIAPEYVHEVDIGAKEKVLTIDYDGLFEDKRTWH